MLLLLSYLGGVLTLLSPCILPVLPLVFMRADHSFLRHGLPLLLGMAISFTVVASVAALGSQWLVQANQIGRWLALALMAAFALALLFPVIADRLLAPLQRLGNRVDQQAGRGNGIRTSILLGVATGLLWAPCAGPILGLILTGAALHGASVGTSALLLAYALGAATALAAVLLLGGRLYAQLRRRPAAITWLRRIAGVAALTAVVAIAMGLDTGLLARLSTASTARIEQALLDRASGTAGNARSQPATQALPAQLPDEGPMPSLAGATGWLNGGPLDADALRGKVVLIDFWTYSCINCLRSIPHVREWAERYKDQGLVVIGVHTPEFAFERDPDNIRRAIASQGVSWPVAVDNNYAIWRAFKNQYWPAHYFIDAQGRIRAHQFGEGNTARSEQVIRQLLTEAGHAPPVMAPAAAELQGVEMQADVASLRSPETYLGYHRASGYAGAPALARDSALPYTAPQQLALNQWALDGTWLVEAERAQLLQAQGRIAFRFHARDLHLVLGTSAGSPPVRMRVRIDGHAPGEDAGHDIDAQGNGVVDGQRLYQLLRQRGEVREHLFEIEFLDPGVSAYAFTFG